MAQGITPDAILQLGFGYWGSKTLLSAVELGLFTELAQGPLPLDDVRTRLGLHGGGLGSFLVQELKRECYLAGRVPAARTDLRNTASRRTPCKAGLRACGFMMTGKTRSAAAG